MFAPSNSTDYIILYAVIDSIQDTDF